MLIIIAGDVGGGSPTTFADITGFFCDRSDEPGRRLEFTIISVTILLSLCLTVLAKLLWRTLIINSFNPCHPLFQNGVPIVSANCPSSAITV